MGSIDTMYIFTVTDTALTLGGKTGVLKFEGYYKPFFISYRDNGDIVIAGNFDYIAGRDNWTWYPLSLDAGLKAEAYSHDSLISNPDPNDTRQVIRDTLFVTGRETLTIKGMPVECIKAVRTYYYELTGLKYGFKIKDALHVDYWYAPSLGYWAKVNINDKGFIDTFTLIDFTL